MEQAGPIISYNKPLDKMIVDKSVPLSDGSIRWPSTVSPIDTPAWGINASPKIPAYLRGSVGDNGANRGDDIFSGNTHQKIDESNHSGRCQAGNRKTHSGKWEENHKQRGRELIYLFE